MLLLLFYALLCFVIVCIYLVMLDYVLRGEHFVLVACAYRSDIVSWDSGDVIVRELLTSACGRYQNCILSTGFISASQ